jgi:thiol-disulfide isomerase/thioredoxin
MGGGLKQAERPRTTKRRDPAQMSAGARRREEARQRARRRKRITTYGIPAAVVGVVVIVAVALSLGGAATKTRSAPTVGPVTVSGPPRGAPLQAGERIPDFTANLLSGGDVRWSDYTGTPTVLALWAPWCPHCQKELPILSEVAQEFPSVKLLTIVTAVDLHPGPTPDGYLRSRGLALATALDDENGTLGTALGLQAFPTVYFVDAQGVVRQAFVGESSAQQVRANIEQILG